MAIPDVSFITIRMTPTGAIQFEERKMISKGQKIEPAQGKLGVVIPGMGAVTSTFIAGVEAIKKGYAKPIGSLTQMGTIRLGKRTDNRIPKIKDFIPLASLDDLVFGGWDIFSDNIYQAASKAGVLERSLIDSIRPALEAISPWPAAFDKSYVRRLDGTNVKKAANKMELAEQVQDDIKNFQKKTQPGPYRHGLVRKHGNLPETVGRASDHRKL